MLLPLKAFESFCELSKLLLIYLEDSIVLLHIQSMTFTAKTQRALIQIVIEINQAKQPSKEEESYKSELKKFSSHQTSFGRN